jgi:hypothetical protein
VGSRGGRHHAAAPLIARRPDRPARNATPNTRSPSARRGNRCHRHRCRDSRAVDITSRVGLPGAPGTGPLARRSMNSDCGPAASIFVTGVDEQRVVSCSTRRRRLGFAFSWSPRTMRPRAVSLVTKDVHSIRRAVRAAAPQLVSERVLFTRARSAIDPRGTLSPHGLPRRPAARTSLRTQRSDHRDRTDQAASQGGTCAR